MRFLLVYFLIGISLACQPATAKQEPRLALLIANQDYKPAIGALQNPIRDVQLVGEALRGSGFEVVDVLRNADRAQILRSVRQFADRLKSAGEGAVGLVYYAGHGAAIRSQNYLIPVDVTKPDGDSLADGSVLHTEIFGRLLEGAPQAAHFIVMDACRNNLGGTRGPRGFKDARAPEGMIIFYSTAPGAVAFDEGPEGSPFATAFAEELRKPERTDQEVTHSIRVRVDKLTRGEQTPWTEDGLRRAERIMLGIRSDRLASPVRPGIQSHPKDQKCSSCHEDTISKESVRIRDRAGEGNVQAMTQLGLMLYHGRGMEKDIGKSVQWFRNAADKDYPPAISFLGEAYRDGDGVEQDYVEALKLFERAAALGWGEAKYNLGQMHWQGIGVKQDRIRALQFFEDAAEQRNSNARFFLASLYDRGERVGRDPDRAAHMIAASLISGSDANFLRIARSWANWSPAFQEALRRKALASRFYSGHPPRVEKDGTVAWIHEFWARIKFNALQGQLDEVSGGSDGPRGPSAALVEATENMSPEARGFMIDLMIDNLKRRIAIEGQNVAHWVRLIEALVKRDRFDEARQYLTQGRKLLGGAEKIHKLNDVAQRLKLEPK